MNGCTDMPLGDRLLSHPDPSEAATLEPELLDHLLTCPACWTIVERSRRAKGVWSSDAPSETEIADAFERASSAPRDRVWAWTWPQSVVAYGALGAGLALVTLVAVGTASKGATSTRVSVASNTSTPIAAVSATSPTVAVVAPPADDGGYLVGPNGRLPLADGARIRLGRAEHARIVLGAGWKPIEVEGPGLVEAWSAPSETCGWRFEMQSASSLAKETETTRILMPTREPELGQNLGASAVDGIATGRLLTAPNEPAIAPRESTLGEEPSVPPRGPLGAPKAAVTHGLSAQTAAAPAASGMRERTAQGSAVETTSSSGAWARAARALDRGDFDGADRALSELCRNDDPRTRDAARLTRAKLWIGHGRIAAVRPVLQDLASNGATPLVRRDAQDLLDEWHAQ